MPTTADDLALRFGDVRVARPDDHVDRAASSRCRTRARRSPAHRRRGTPRRRRRARPPRGSRRGTGAVGAGRNAQHDLGHARDAGRQRGHQHRRRVAAPARRARSNRPGRPGRRARAPRSPSARVGLPLALRLVPRHDLVAGELERGPQLAGRGARARPPISARRRPRARRASHPSKRAVRSRDGVVAAGPHVGDDLGDDAADVVARPRSGAGEPARRSPEMPRRSTRASMDGSTRTSDFRHRPPRVVASPAPRRHTGH